MHPIIIDEKDRVRVENKSIIAIYLFYNLLSKNPIISTKIPNMPIINDAFAYSG